METAVQKDLRRELAGAMRILTPKCRKWIRALPEHGFRRRSCSDALGFSSRTVWRWLRDPKVRRALDILQQIEVQDLDVSYSRIVGEYAAMAFARPKDYVDEAGKLKSIKDLDSDSSAAVLEFEVNDAGQAVPSKLHPKKPALDALVALQRFAPAQRVELTGKDESPLIPPAVNDLEIARRVAFILSRGVHAAET